MYNVILDDILSQAEQTRDELVNLSHAQQQVKRLTDDFPPHFINGYNIRVFCIV